MAVKAKESPQVLKARRKLKKQMAEESKRITSHALDKMAKNIEYWLNRHKGERVQLKDKSITLFDANHHPAATRSKFVRHMLQNLKKETDQDQVTNTLGGRITL